MTFRPITVDRGGPRALHFLEFALFLHHAVVEFF